MRRILPLGMVAFAMLFGAMSSQVLAQRDDLKSKIDRQATPLLERGEVVGLVVGVVKDGESHVFTYGEVEKGSGQAPASDTVYEIGSVTKVFTGILLADAVSRAEVALDDPISQHLPRRLRVPVFEDQPIKLVHLSTHTSGLPRIPDNMPFSDPLDPYADYTDQLVYKFLKSHELTEAPGKWAYSNLGAGLLGHILARKAGKSYEELVTERICRPLEMNDTVITLSDEQQTRLAPPYDQQLVSNKNWEFEVLAGAGALRSTCDDMLKFIEAQFRTDDDPLTKAIQAAHEIHHEADGTGPDMGLGWLRAGDGITYLHGGGTGGYHSYLAVSPSQKLGVIVLTNSASEALDITGEKLIQTVYGLDVEPNIPAHKPKEMAVDPAILQQYVGTYRLAPTFAIEVTLEDGHLMAQATGQDKLEVFPQSETEFFYKVVDAQLSFVRTEDGSVEKLILHQAGQHVDGIRE